MIQQLQDGDGGFVLRGHGVGRSYACPPRLEDTQFEFLQNQAGIENIRGIDIMSSVP